MKKKILVALAILLAVSSLAFNYFIFETVLGDYVNEEERLRKSFLITSILSTPILNKSITNTYQDDPAIILMDSTFTNFNTIMEELTGVSGGLNINGEYINAYGTIYVNSYFHGENHFRNNAIEYFDKNITNYLTNIDTLNIESSLKKVYEVTTDYAGGLTFEQMTVAESINMLQSICLQILTDKYAYLLTKTE